MKLFFILFSCFLTNILFATEFTATTSRAKVAVGETITVSFTIDAHGSEFRPPQFTDFRIVGGPNQSTSTQWINGAVSQKHSFSFVLLASKEGVFNIPPATIKSNNQLLQSNALTIEVVKPSAQQQQQQQLQQQNARQQQQQQQQQQITEEDLSKNLFLKVSVDKTNPFVGEQVILSFKLYHRVNLVNLGFNKLPALNGFWSELIEDNNGGNIHFQAEVLDGVSYNVAEIRKFVLFAQRSGTLEIDPLSLDCIVRSRSNKRSQSVFDQFFGTFEDAKYTVSSKLLNIQVLPLPENGKPIDFKGAVGKFSVEARLDKNKVRAHEAVNLFLNISGKGNLPLMETPAPVFPVDVEVYDPQLKDKTSISSSGVSGTKSFEFLMIPRHSGTFTIEPIQFSYFDPVLKSYKTLTTGPFEIQVEKAAKEDDGGIIVSGKRQEDIKTVGNDIRYINTHTPEFTFKGSFFFGSSFFYILLALPIFLFVGFIIARKRYVKVNSNLVLVKSKKATKIAIKRLELAKKHLETNNESQFYNEIFKALYGYFGDKFNMPVTMLNKDNITLHLKNKNISEPIIDKVALTIDLCEMARFAPVTDISVKTVYSDTTEVIAKLEGELK
ncbi:MAG: protein BatD [Bacteroidetes bacterium]|nr:protein BatD [Bacteroidota bacterium]HET6243665.1 BatD family protein [Bacteroidia bacterium]